MPDKQSTPKIIAAVDLGSNSFHMILARVDNGQAKTIDRLKESVRLGEGLDANKHLIPEVAERALACLARFSQRIGDLENSAVRAVGTNTLRRINDGGAFLYQAEQTLGRKIDIIAGREEARLIYTGVAHGLAPGDQNRLVIDIGGGSTELALGRQMSADTMDSLFMGCVSISQRFFPNGNISKQAMDDAILACRLEIHPVTGTYHNRNWQEVVGSSGTIKAIRDVLQAADAAETTIEKKSLKHLRKAIIAAGTVEELNLPGLSDSRKPVFAAGVAILSALFKALDIERMRVSELALKEGLIYQMLGMSQHHDIRQRTVESLVERYGLDNKQGQLVANTAKNLLNQIAVQWDLGDPEYLLLLAWSAILCEIGLAVTHNGYHKHGAYILANSDLQGFSRRQQAILATLVLGHRRKFDSNRMTDSIKCDQNICQRLSILLRLSVLLHRGHSHIDKPDPIITVSKKNIQVVFPTGWLSKHPLTLAELAEESQLLADANYQLDFE